MNLDKSQLDFCNSKAEYIRLLAPAGSGKTLSLLWRCKSLFESSKTEKPKFLIFTFTRVAKDELSYRLQTDTDFTEIKNLVKIDTLNQWGFNYLKSIEKGLSLKANKKDRFFLVKNMLRPIWSNSGYKEIFEKKQNKYNDILNIFDSLKSLGFNHTIDDESIINHTNDQLAWIRENQVDRYFNSAIKKDENGYYVHQATGECEEKVYFPYEDTAVFVVDIIMKGPDISLILNTTDRTSLEEGELVMASDNLYLLTPDHRIKFSSHALVKISKFIEEKNEKFSILINEKTYLIRSSGKDS